MRIAHVTQPTTAGAAIVARDLARVAQAAGLETVVFSPQNGDLPGWCADLGLEWRPVALGRAPSPSDMKQVRSLHDQLRRFDLVHLHSSKAGAVGRLALRRCDRTGVVVTPHGWSWYAGGTLTKPVYRAIERGAARWADAVVCVSEQERRAGERVLGSRTRLEVIPNGVDTARFRPPVGRRESGLVVCVGRLCRQKGQDLLLRAVASADDPSLRVRLVGSGPDAGSLARLAESLRLGGRVELVGEADPLPHLQAAAVVVCPSRWDGMSLALLEAMSTAAAVVATSVSGSEALGTTGVLVDARDEDRTVRDLSSALVALVGDQARAAALGRGARRRVVERYSVERAGQRHLELWDRVVDGVRR